VLDLTDRTTCCFSGCIVIRICCDPDVLWVDVLWFRYTLWFGCNGCPLFSFLFVNFLFKNHQLSTFELEKQPLYNHPVIIHIKNQQYSTTPCRHKNHKFIIGENHRKTGSSTGHWKPNLKMQNTTISIRINWMCWLILAGQNVR
jgi:hypothetical protein